MKHSDINPDHFLDLPLARILIRKNLNIFRSFLRDSYYQFLYHKEFDKTRTLRDSRKGDTALILANGTRLIDGIKNGRQNFPQILSADVFCINHYILHEDLVGVKPDYYLLMDNDYYSQSSSEQSILSAMNGNHCSRADAKMILDSANLVREKVFNLTDVKVFIPVKKFKHYCRHNIYPINGVCSPAVNNFSDVTRTLSWHCMTGYMAISLAIYLGYTDIYLAGFDNDSFKSLEFDRESMSYQYDYSHFYSEPSSFSNKSTSSLQLSELLSEMSLIFRMHSKCNFTNLDPCGLI